jgi:hypothetical protein
MTRLTAFCIFALAAMNILGCAHSDSDQKLAAPVEPERPKQTVESNPTPTILPDEPHLMDGSGLTVWAKEFEGQLIEGLDGNLYEAYARPVIEHVQKALNDRGLYNGPVNGVLDRPTMKSIFAFQNANYQLQHCGIPTPHTRKMLEQGSHTDLSD